MAKKPETKAAQAQPRTRKQWRRLTRSLRPRPLRAGADPVEVQARALVEANRRFNLGRPAHEHRSTNVVKVRRALRRQERRRVRKQQAA